MSDNPRVTLARTLYEEMERLAPGVGDYVEWDALPQWERDLHIHGVRRLLLERDLVMAALREGSSSRCRFCCSAQNIPDGQDVCTICQANPPAMTIDLAKAPSP